MHKYVVVDAFTRRPLEGNPVAVFFDAADLSTQLMQRIANEMHLSEVTFVLPPENGGDARIRIFTPVNELPFAGHPILGTATALAQAWSVNRLRLETAMGVIAVQVENDAGVARVVMRQPVPTWRPYEHPAQVLVALGVAKSTAPIEVYRNGPRHVFIGLPDVPGLAALRPDHRALSQLRDVAVNCFAGAGAHWRSRMFSPAYGVVEDAATGSAAGPLAVHLARHGLAAWRQEIRIEQGIEIGRRSIMSATADGDGDLVRSVAVAGHATVIATGTIHV